jgi:hypothetical protein
MSNSPTCLPSADVPSPPDAYWTAERSAGGSVADNRPRRAYKPYLQVRACQARTRAQWTPRCKSLGKRAADDAAHRTHEHSPRAFDELRDAMNGIAIVRHDTACQALHVNQPPVIARKKKQAALARAVVRQRYLDKRHNCTLNANSCLKTMQQPAPCEQLCRCEN